MAFSIRVREDGRRPGSGHPLAATVSRRSRTAAGGGGEKSSLAETEAWLWAQNAVFSGYGPPPSVFL